MDVLNITAKMLIDSSLNFAERKGICLHEGFTTVIRENELFRKAVVSVLAEAKNLKEYNIIKWDRIAQNMAEMKEISGLRAPLEPNSPETNKQRAINSQIAITLYGMFCMSGPAINELCYQAFLTSEELHYLIAEGFALRLVLATHNPEWKKGILFLLQYPDVVNAINEKVKTELMVMVPSDYRNTLESTIRNEGLTVAFENVSNQMPEWIVSGAISEENFKKTMLVQLLIKRIPQKEDLLVLANNNLPVMSSAFSESLSILSATMSSSLDVEQIIQHMAQPNVAIQRGIDRCCAFIQGKLETANENVDRAAQQVSTPRP